MGAQQRLNLARAFIARQRMLLLDELTASLDAYSKAIVLKSITEAKHAGVTIVTVSPACETMAGIADDGLALED